ncbi:hypothetical protein [Actinoplanes sp. URMC 104]|uniref:hypothetical protein n=1 Tax=Actinoplanes sp. URMC 104 TaxID=3423409 RepID=UPI003F197BF4
MAKTDEYGLVPPTEEAALEALGELVGPGTAAGLWDISCRALYLPRPVEAVSDLRRVAEHLMETGDLMRVTGRSLKVRAITFDALSGIGS